MHFWTIFQCIQSSQAFFIPTLQELVNQSILSRIELFHVAFIGLWVVNAHLLLSNVGAFVLFQSEWIDSIDYTVDPARSQSFYAAVRRYWPALKDGALQPGSVGHDLSAHRSKPPGGAGSIPGSLSELAPPSEHRLMNDPVIRKRMQLETKEAFRNGCDGAWGGTTPRLVLTPPRLRAGLGCDDVRLVARGITSSPHPGEPARARTVTPVRSARRSSGTC